jgi:flavin reductase (DIM6/NTAB) family NADH-FMN oxidoreductase RutF/rubredoxin
VHARSGKANIILVTLSKAVKNLDNKGLYKIGYGMYIITSGKDGKCNGQIANTVAQISSDPPTVAISINKQNYTHEIIKQSQSFAISVLSKDTPLSFIGNYGFKSGRDCDKFVGSNCETGIICSKIVIDNTVAIIEAKLIKELDVFMHTIFVGEVLSSKVLSDQQPMTYDYYRQIKKGSTPPTAPTFVQVQKNETQADANLKYECEICGYIYDPIVGDPESGIPPGTPFEKLPLDWVCPICRAEKTRFIAKKS